MPNYQGNPDIAKYGKATRFGAGKNCPYAAQQVANKPWSCRMAAKRIGGHCIETNKPITIQRFLKIFGSTPTLAQYLTTVRFCKALQGDFKSMIWVEEMIDGPLLTEDEVRMQRKLGTYWE